MRHTAIVLLAAGSAALAACGDDDGSSPDGSALVDAFDARATALYEAEDRDRDEEFARGLALDDCPILNDEHAEAVLAAAEIDADEPAARGGYLQGVPGESEILTCWLSGGEGPEDRVALTLGTTLRDVDQVEQAVRRSGFPDAQRVEVDAPGLPDDEVLVLQVERSTKAYWVGDGFLVSVDLLSAEDEAPAADQERAAATLAAAVEQVDDALTG